MGVERSWPESIGPGCIVVPTYDCDHRRACATFRKVVVIGGNKLGGNQIIRVPAAAAACMPATNERNNGRNELDRSSTSLCAAATYRCLGILCENIGSCCMHADQVRSIAQTFLNR